MYNFNHLYYFYITAKSGGVTSASTHLRISQPSLSSQIKVLEESLDIRLFYKVGRRNKLTPAGLVIYGFCRQMFEISEQMGEIITKQVPSAARHIHIGVSNEVDRPFVVEVISTFLKKHGLSLRPRITVSSGNHEQLIERLRFRELDAIVTQFATISPELVNLEKAEVPVVLTCTSKLKLPKSKKAQLPAETLKSIFGDKEAQLLMPSPLFKLRTETNLFFEDNKIIGKIVFESDVIASLVRSVVDEIGIAFLPLIFVAREIREKTIHILGCKDGYWKYRVWLTCHSQNNNDALIKALALSFKEVCNDSHGCISD